MKCCAPTLAAAAGLLDRTGRSQHPFDIGSPQPVRHLTGAEFLAFERAAATKHELVNGEVHDMAGGSPTHSLIAANLIREMGVRLDGKGCNPYTSDLRIKVEETGLHTYPDVSVACGELEFADGERDTVTNPVLLVEVLSPSTEAYDRGVKFAHYRRLRDAGEGHHRIGQARGRPAHGLHGLASVRTGSRYPAAGEDGSPTGKEVVASPA